MFCQSVPIGRCQCNLKRFLPLSSYQLHTLEEHNLTITSGFPEQISNCLRNLFVVQLRRLRWFKHNESCAKPNLTRICPLDMRAKPESVYLAPASACTARPSRPALPGPGLSSSFLLSLLSGAAGAMLHPTLPVMQLWHSQSSWRRIIPAPISHWAAENMNRWWLARRL